MVVTGFRALAAAALVVLLFGGLASASGRGSQATAYRLQSLFRVSIPVHVATPPGDARKLYVVEEYGRIRLAVGGKLRAQPFLDIRRLVSTKGEQGFLSIAFHPAYARNRLFYIDYTDLKGDTRVVEYRATRDGTRALPKTARRVLYVRQPGPSTTVGSSLSARTAALRRLR